MKKQKKKTVREDMRKLYMPLALHLFLWVVTCGVWQIVFLIRTSLFVGRDPNTRNYVPKTQILLTLFVPVYSYIWVYKTAGRIDGMSA